MEGTGELEEEHYGDRSLHSVSNKAHMDKDARCGAAFEIMPRRLLSPGSPPACSWSGPMLLTQVLALLVVARCLVMDQWPLMNWVTGMSYHSHSFMFCPSFTLNFIFSVLYPVVDIVFSITQWTGGLRSDTATRQSNAWVKPEGRAWSCQAEWIPICNIWSQLSKILPALAPE